MSDQAPISWDEQFITVCYNSAGSTSETTIALRNITSIHQWEDRGTIYLGKDFHNIFMSWDTYKALKQAWRRAIK